MAELIPTFEDLEPMSEVRTKSLNPTIEKVNELNSKAQTVEQDVADMKLLSSQNHADIATLIGNVETVTDTANAAQTKSLENETAITANIHSINHIDDTLLDLDDQIKDSGNRILDLESSSAIVESELTSIQQQFTDVNTAVDQLETEVDGLITRIESNELDINGINVSIDKHTTDLVGLVTSIGQTNTRLTAVTNRLSLMEMTGTESIFTQDNNDQLSWRYSMTNRVDGAPMPCGTRISGNASIINDPSVNQVQGGGISGEGALKFLADGSTSITTTVNIAADHNIPAGGSEAVAFWWVRYTADGTESIVDNSSSTATVFGDQKDVLVMITLPTFTTEITAGDRLGIRSQATGDGYAYIKSTSPDAPLLENDINYVEQVDISKMLYDIRGLEDRHEDLSKVISGLYSTQSAGPLTITSTWEQVPVILDDVKAQSILYQTADGYLTLEGGQQYDVLFTLKTDTRTTVDGVISIRMVDSDGNTIHDTDGHNIEHNVNVAVGDEILKLSIDTSILLTQDTIVRPIVNVMPTGGSSGGSNPTMDIVFSPSTDQTFNIVMVSGAMAVIKTMITT